MRSRRVALELWIVIAIVLLPIAALAQTPKVRPATVATVVLWRTVPGVVGRTVPIATEVIARAGLVAKVETVPVRSRAWAPGTVVRQSPSPGDSLPPRGTVTIFAAAAPVDTARSESPPNITVPPPVEVPNLTGDSPGVATERLRSIGLIPAFGPQQLADSERAKVVKQSPTPGTSVAVKSIVRLGLVVDNLTTVPNVLTMTSDQVQAKVIDAQLRLVEQQAADTIVPAGRVVSQQPPGGARVAINSPMTVTYSSGPPLVRVPNLVDSTGEAAQATLARSLFSVGKVDSVNSTVRIGRVVWQEPPADSLVPKGSTVRFHIARQAPVTRVTVPPLIGQTLQTAPSRLNRQLRLDFVDSVPNAAPASTIVRQDPPAGASVPAGSDVHVWTAYPPPPKRIDSVTVPPLIGLTRSQAIDRIGTARLRVGRQLTADGGTPGRISRQEPPANTRQPVDALVSFWIVSAQQVNYTTVPLVTNHLLDSALTLLDRANLSAQLSDVSAVREPGHWAVISQRPVAGTRVRVQSAVRLVVEHLVDSVAVPAVVDSSRARAELTLATGGFGMAVRQRQFAWTLRETVLVQLPIAGASAIRGDLVRVDLSYPLGFMAAIAVPLLGGGIPAGTMLARKVWPKKDPEPPPPLDIRVEPVNTPAPAPELELAPNDDFVRLSITLDVLAWTLESVVDGTNDPITLDQGGTDA